MLLQAGRGLQSHSKEGVTFQNKSCIFTCKQWDFIILMQVLCDRYANCIRLANCCRPVVRELFLSCHGDLRLETRAGLLAVRRRGRETYVYIMCTTRHEAGSPGRMAALPSAVRSSVGWGMASAFWSRKLTLMEPKGLPAVWAVTRGRRGWDPWSPAPLGPSRRAPPNPTGRGREARSPSQA